MSAEKNKRRYVLDTYAVLTYLKEEPGWRQVKDLLWDAFQKKCNVYMSQVNIGELYYILYRECGAGSSDRVIAVIRHWPVKFMDVKADTAIVAGRIKAENRLSYADAYVVATALAKKAAILTGDREFKSVEDIAAINWLPKNKGS